MQKTGSISLSSVLISKLGDYALLTKLRLASLVVFSALIGYLFAADSVFTPTALLLLALGGTLVTGSANAINQVIEKDIDKLMNRTQNRPLPAGRMSAIEAILIAGICGVAGISLISFYFNTLAGVISAISLFSYAFVYTPLKRISPAAVFVGAIPGALPPMIGYVCASAQIDFMAIYLFSIQFIWQFPHFWSIAWLQFEDYQKAGIMLLPSSGGKTAESAIQNIAYCLALIPLGILPFVLHITGTVSMVLLLIAALFFLWKAIDLYRLRTDKAARQLMFASFVYLPIAQIVLLADKL
jgi:protoheme IX farnesyltransferase